jgi:ribosomal protein S18 acetylase RimI-like enzyme
MEIRFLNIEDLSAYRDLRLQALRESPTAFCSSYEQEAEFSWDDFAARLHCSDVVNGVFGALNGDALDSDTRLVGMLGFSRESRLKRAHIASLWSMYVVPNARGQGIGAALLDTAISHAQKLDNLRQITLSVNASNLAACALYKSRGFERFGLERGAICVDGNYFDEEYLVLSFNL